MSVATVSRALSQPHLLRPDTRTRCSRWWSASAIARTCSRAGCGEARRAPCCSSCRSSACSFSRFSPALKKRRVPRASPCSWATAMAIRSARKRTSTRCRAGSADGIILLTGTCAFRVCARQAAVAAAGHGARATAGPRRAGGALGSPPRRAEATRHLIELGHRRIAHIAGTQACCEQRRTVSPATRMRWPQAGIAYSEELVQTGDFSMDSGVTAMERLLALENPPTAVFAGNDEMAFGAMHAARAQGPRRAARPVDGRLRRPEDRRVLQPAPHHRVHSRGRSWGGAPPSNYGTLRRADHRPRDRTPHASSSSAKARRPRAPRLPPTRRYPRGAGSARCCRPRP